MTYVIRKKLSIGNRCVFMELETKLSIIVILLVVSSFISFLGCTEQVSTPQNLPQNLSYGSMIRSTDNIFPRFEAIGSRTTLFSTHLEPQTIFLSPDPNLQPSRENRQLLLNSNIHGNISNELKENVGKNLLTPYSSTDGSSMNSQIWAGYADVSTGFTSVKGSWIVEKFQTGYDIQNPGGSQWIGIGGMYGNGYLIQTGTNSLGTLFGTEYNAWIETVPGGTQTLEFHVSQGDVMTASIQEISTGSWQISISDITQGWNYVSSQISFEPNTQTAEWIEEWQGSSLADFGQALFGPYYTHQAYDLANGNQISNYPYYIINMSGNYGEANTSPLFPDPIGHYQPPYYDRFTVDWVSSS